MNNVSPDSFSSLDDESLMLLIRYNVPAAAEALLARHERKKNVHVRRAIPEYANLFDEWTRDELFLRSFLIAESHYRFRASKFSNYLELILRREALKEAFAVFRDSSRIPFSLDEELPMEEGIVFSDVMASNRVEDDPSAFLSYAEGLLAISKLPKGIRPEAVRIVERLQNGESFEDAAKHEGVSHGSARGMVYRYRAWAKKTLESLGRNPDQDMVPKKGRGKK